MLGNKVIIVGGYPPPFGGITVHVQRLANVLNQHYDVKIVDFYGKPAVSDQSGSGAKVYRLRRGSVRTILSVLKDLFVGRGIVHLHVSSVSNVLRLLFFVATKSTKTLLLTIHGGSFADRISKKGLLSRSLLRWTLACFDRIILVNSEQQKALKTLHIPESKIAIIPAYIKAEAVPSIDIISKMAEIRLRNDLILISSGFGLSYYGYHDILQALSVTYRDKKVALILALYNSYDERYLSNLHTLSVTLEHVEYLILQDTHPDEFNYVLGQCDTYIRATTRDGDSVAVREALQLGLNVICSDCVERPNGTVLFHCNSAESLSAALCRASRSQVPRALSQHDNAKEILEVYECLR